MNIQPMDNKVISLSQIINRHQARYRIRFKSERELSDPEIWREIINHRAAFAHFEATVIDQTPEEKIDGLKKFTIIYGLKYLFAAEMLNLETIPVKVLKHTERLDSAVVTEFFNADYLSLSGYEKGEFIGKLMKKTNLTLNDIARKAGFTYSAVQSMYSAYKNSKNFPPLKEAYMNCRITASLVNFSIIFYKSSSPEIHQKLTDFLVEGGKKANTLLRTAMENRDSSLTVSQMIWNVINEISEEQAEVPKRDIFEDVNSSLKADGVDMSEIKQTEITEKMKNDKKYRVQILSYQTIREKSLEAYDRLCSILPKKLILDYDTSLTLPNRTQFSYAAPKKMKKMCRNRINQNITDKRLFMRIMEYFDTADENLSCSDLLEITENMYMNQYTRKQFSSFFKFSILYRNKRDKVIATVQK